MCKIINCSQYKNGVGYIAKISIDMISFVNISTNNSHKKVYNRDCPSKNDIRKIVNRTEP